MQETLPLFEAITQDSSTNLGSEQEFLDTQDCAGERQKITKVTEQLLSEQQDIQIWAFTVTPYYISMKAHSNNIYMTKKDMKL